MDMKTARKRVGLTQAELAQRINSSQTTVNFIESGKKFPDEQTQFLINRALNADIDWSLHDNAPLSGVEKTYLSRLFERTLEFDDPQETAKFLTNQDRASLRKMFRLAGVDNVVEPLSVPGFDYGKRRKK
jgi:transcriptional regulator with XRE-family HTH domain